jgi:hypothetical protein
MSSQSSGCENRKRCHTGIPDLASRVISSDNSERIDAAFVRHLLFVNQPPYSTVSCHVDRFAVLVSHVLDTVWAGLRVSSTSQTKKLYETFVVNDACGGVDINTALWDAKMTIAVSHHRTGLSSEILAHLVLFRSPLSLLTT